MWFPHPLLPLALFLLAPPPIGAEQFYSVNTSALDALWHRAAVMALLKLKANSLLSADNFPTEERTVFAQCSQDARTVVALAKCVSALLAERERLAERKRQRKEAFGGTVVDTTREMPASTLEGLMDTLRDTLGTVFGGMEVHNATAKAQEQQEMQITLEKKTLRFAQLPFQQIDWKRKRRQRRSISRKPNKGLVHLANLRQLQRFWEIRRYCEDYLGGLAEQNAEFLRSHLPHPVQFSVGHLGEQESRGRLLQQISARLSSFMEQGLRRQRKGPMWRRLSIMSPRLFPILAPDNVRSSSAPMEALLSPRLFSLHPNDGLFALPDLFGVHNTQDGRADRLMNQVLEISGAGRAIQRALEELKGERARWERQVFPMVLELEQRDTRWRNLISGTQQREIQEQGFTFLGKEQTELLYGKERADTFDPMFAIASPEQRHRRLERAIQQLAHLDENATILEKQNDTTTLLDNFGPEETGSGEKEKEEENHLHVLAPYAFANFVADGVALEAIILSPHAFIAELLTPVALSAEVLSPRAFIAAILSPEALYARILSPTAFSAEVLSPRALTPFVLSPEAMVAEILSPRALEPRVLSPEVGLIKVLSPEFLSPRVLSAEQLAVIVLSPTILSPGVLSHHALTVEVISPHILSGNSGEEEEAHEGHNHNHGHDKHEEHGHGKEEHGSVHGKEGTDGGHHAQSGHGQKLDHTNEHQLMSGEQKVSSKPRQQKNEHLQFTTWKR